MDTRLMDSFAVQDNLGKTAQEWLMILDSNEAGDDRVAVTSAGPYANYLHFTPGRLPCQHLITQFFTGQMLFLTPNQQCQSTEGSTSN